MTITSNREIGLAVVSAMTTCNIPALREVVHEDVHWWLPRSAARIGRPQVVIGRDQVEKNFQHSFSTRYKTLRPEILHVVHDDTSCFVLFDMFIHTGKGQDYQNQYFLFMKINDGKAVEVWELADTALAWEYL